MASTFPQQKDDIQSFLDVTSSDFEAINGYQNAIRTGNFAQAQTYLTQIANADRKIISADKLNQIKDALDAVQQFYKTDIQPYVAQKQQEWQGIINQFTYKGRYSATISYVKNNIIVYNINGRDYLFICNITPNTIGIPPTDTSYWTQFTIQGKQGQTGSEVSTTFLFEWDSSTEYAENVLVVYNNKWWISKLPSLNQTPQEGSDYWGVAMTTYQMSFPISSGQPLNQDIGGLWFKVV